ncbi:MAG: hypothetical protein K5695_11455 [Oscillospiraceae bacterium]|nr:hypothetical protein [Oscillospiraceae bacterium]
MTELEKLNRFTRREHQAEEVYLFDVVLCDNDVDRDLECFSEEALTAMRGLFVGKTGIFDHDMRALGQTARIYDTALIPEAGRLTKDGRPYVALTAKAYMIRTASNADLIREIEGGIKKEVSVSCSAGRRSCSVCGADRSGGGCAHVPGRYYDGKLCCTVLDDVKDAYEWSFVAVPAQVSAGVTKRFTGEQEVIMENEKALLDEVEKMLREEVLVLCGRENAISKALCMAADKMDIGELMAFKRALLAESCGEAEVQLAGAASESPDGAFRMP